MRTITFMYDSTSSNLPLNIFSQIARKQKRVLVIDLRIGIRKAFSQVGLSIKKALQEQRPLKEYITPLEANFDYIGRDTQLDLEEFSSFNELIEFTYFKQQIEHLNYDYVIFVTSPQLHLLTINALMSSQEVMLGINIEKSGMEYIYKTVSFIHSYNTRFSQKLLLTKIIPSYSKHLSKLKFVHLISHYGSKLIPYPLELTITSKEHKIGLKKIAQSIFEDEALFDLTISCQDRERKIQEYLLLIEENSKLELPLGLTSSSN